MSVLPVDVVEVNSTRIKCGSGKPHSEALKASETLPPFKQTPAAAAADTRTSQKRQRQLSMKVGLCGSETSGGGRLGGGGGGLGRVSAGLHVWQSSS